MKGNYLYKALIVGIVSTSFSTIYAGGCSSDKDDESVKHRSPTMKKNELHQRVRYSTEKKSSGEWGGRNPTSFGCPPNDGFIISLDYLLMRAKNENLVYAYQVNNRENSPEFFASTLRQGNMVQANRTWRPGFRIAVGSHTPFDDWDTNAQWTYYYNRSTTDVANESVEVTSANVNTGEGLYPYWSFAFTPNGAFNNSTTPFYQQLQAAWRLNYNVIDWDIGRSMYLGKAFAFRPFLGLRNGWIYQRMDVTYMQSLISGTLNSKPLNSRVNYSHRFWGIGMRTGFDTEWELGAGFSIKSLIAASLLSGRTKARRIQSVPNVVNNVQLDQFLRAENQTISQDQIAPNLELNLGLGWGTCLSNDTMYLGFDIAWQSIYWWGQFTFVQPYNTYSVPTARIQSVVDYPFVDKYLNMEGIVVRGRFDF